jgi:hypothetical protein
MRMPVVGIRIMRMLVRHGFVLVAMSVPLPRRYWAVMSVLVVHIVFVLVGVLHRLVKMRVCVPFREVQPDAESHEQRGGRELPCHRLTKKNDRNRCAGEGCCREVCSGARGSQMTEGHNE